MLFISTVNLYCLKLTLPTCLPETKGGNVVLLPALYLLGSSEVTGRNQVQKGKNSYNLIKLILEGL